MCKKTLSKRIRRKEVSNNLTSPKHSHNCYYPALYICNTADSYELLVWWPMIKKAQVWRHNRYLLVNIEQDQAWLTHIPQSLWILHIYYISNIHFAMFAISQGRRGERMDQFSIYKVVNWSHLWKTRVTIVISEFPFLFFFFKSILFIFGHF